MARALLVAVSIVVVALLLAAGVAVAVGTSGPVLDSDLFASLVVLLVTTIGLAAASRLSGRFPASQATGDYLFLVFAAAVGSLADLGDLAESASAVLPYLAVTLIAAIVLHYVLCLIARIDVDTAIVTSTAAVFGPPFVPPVARAIGSDWLVATGVTTGVLGLAIGNYLGLTIAALLN